jgi:hypothetical protein
MARITLFSTPKPFTDPFIATIQRNALRSWSLLGPEVDVVLIGDESGIEEVSLEMGFRHIREVERNEWGTPLVRSLIKVAQDASENELLTVVNADILLMQDFVEAVQSISSQTDSFLMIGRRWGLDIDTEMEFNPVWEEKLRRDVDEEGILHPIFSIDYFVFRRGQYRELPAFVIGRPQWDNWMIYHARLQGWLVIDASLSVTAIHQNHDYRHLPGGKPPHGLEEGKRNRELAGGDRAKYMIIDANRRFVRGQLQSQPLTLERVLRALELWLMARSFRGLEWRAIRYIRRLREAVGEQLPDGWVAGGLKQEPSKESSAG